MLQRAARLWSEEAILRVRAGAFPTARLSHTQLAPHLDLEGTRLTELARRMDVSKQAAQELVDELHSLGLVERIADPSDGRAKLIRFSARGRRALFEGLDALGAIEDELRREVGDRVVRDLSAELGQVLAFLETCAARRAPAGTTAKPSKVATAPARAKRTRTPRS